MSNNTHKPDNNSSWGSLGIPVQATEAEICAAYNVLAFLHHPDKADEHESAKAASRFQQPQAAYEYCINNIFVSKCATVEDANDESDFYWERNAEHAEAFGLEDWNSDVRDIDWCAEGMLPKGYGGFGTPWWTELKGDEPNAILRWAKMLQWTQEHQSIKMSDEQNASIDTEFHGALSMFEHWRRENIKQRNEKDRLQAKIDRIEPHFCERVCAKLDELRSSLLDEDYTGYEDDVDKEACFLQQRLSQEVERLKAASGLTTSQGPGTNTSVPAYKRLALFKSQIAALKARQETQMSEKEKNMTKKQIKEREVAWERVVERLEEEVEEEKEWKKQRVKRAEAGQRKVIDQDWQKVWKALKRDDLDAEEPEGYQRGGQRKVHVKDVQDYWGDEVAE